MDKNLIKEKLNDLLSGWCNEDLKISAKRYLDLLDTNDEINERVKMIKALEEAICTIEELEEFANSDHATEIIGKDHIDGFRLHVKDIKNKGELYCDCPACKKAIDILNILKNS